MTNVADSLIILWFIGTKSKHDRTAFSWFGQLSERSKCLTSLLQDNRWIMSLAWWNLKC